MQPRHKVVMAASCVGLLIITAACGNSTANNAASVTSSAASVASSAASAVTSAASSAAGGSESPAASGSETAAPSGSSGGGAPAAGPTKNPATDGQTINVLMVNNPQMVDLQSLTAENFTAQTGIKVNYTVLPENDMRNKASLEFKNQAGQYDVTTLSNFEIPFYAKNGWLTSLQDYSTKDAAFNQADIFPAVTASLSSDNQIYGEPFYGESSFLMYRKDVFDAKGLTMPANPTWDQVADLAAKVDGAQPGMKGICLRGQPGWGQLGAPLTTVVNTFGGTWFNADWSAQVNAQPFQEATNFYVDLVKAHGEVGASTAGFTECLSAMEQSKVAMWYDATSAAGSLESKESPVAGKVAYVQAPVKLTKSSGWLYAWSWAMEKKVAHPDAAWQFISWASSQQYEELVGAKLGWPRVPAGKRTSLYSNPDYTAAASAFAPATLEALKTADPTNPGVQPRPTVGIQFVDIPEFTDLGDQVTKSLSAVIAGNGTVADALNTGQDAATEVATNYK